MSKVTYNKRLCDGGVSRHYYSTTAQKIIVVPMLNGGTSAPLLAIYCWQQLIFVQWKK